MVQLTTDKDGAHAETTPRSVIERALLILEAFGVEKSQLSLAELTRLSGLPKPTTHRLARQLVSLGVLEHRGMQYVPSSRLFKLGMSSPDERRLRDCALPFMEDLYEATHEVVHLGVRYGHSVLYIQRISGHKSHQVNTQVGSTRPLHCTAVGKAILALSPPDAVDGVIAAGLSSHTAYTIVTPDLFRAALAEIARAGVAYDREEYCLGVTCVASPILGGQERAIGALSVAGRSGRFDPERMAPAVRTAALGISRSIRRAEPLS